MEKTCKICQQTKPLLDFPKDKSFRDGRYAYCRKCSAEKAKRRLTIPPKRTPAEGLKWCGSCKQDRPLSDFWAFKGTYDGLYFRCRPCAAEKGTKWRIANSAKVNASQRKRRLENPDRYRDYDLKKTYGVPYGTYDAILQSQNGVCAICKRSDTGAKGKRYLSLDHCHDTNVVRGLLCGPCNLAIGQMNHDVEVLKSAIAYLENVPGVKIHTKIITPGKSKR